MKILHWYPNLLGGGGVGTAALGLASAQARLGAEAAIAAAEDGASALYEAMDPGEGVTLARWSPRLSLRAGTALVRLIGREDSRRLRAFRPDVVHVHGEFNPDNLRVPRLFDCPVVLKPAGAFHPVVLGRNRTRKRLYLRLARTVLYDRLAAFHALSPLEAEHVAAAVPGARVYVVPQGPSIRVEAALANGRRAGTGTASGGGVRLLYVGRLDPFQKGLDLLLDALARARAAVPGARLSLDLAGPDWRGGRAALEQQSRRIGLEGAVRFHGALTGAEVAGLLASADVVVQLSRYEGTPSSVTEALVAGTPCVLADTMGTVSYPEIARLPHVLAVPARPDAAAEALVDAVTRLDELRASARGSLAVVRELFSWDRCARLQLERYAELGAAARRAA